MPLTTLTAYSHKVDLPSVGPNCTIKFAMTAGSLEHVLSHASHTARLFADLSLTVCMTFWVTAGLHGCNLLQ